ncbi:HAD hydrolase-like protein [Patescibacteria group bacterium]|nr:HAD hydrolase-like protein [Patescibacteria group bacterium]
MFDIDETMVSIKRGLNAKASRLMFKNVFGADTDEETVDNFSKTESWIIKAVLDKVGIKIDRVPETAYKTWAEETLKMLADDPPKVLPGIREILDALSKNENVQLSLLTGNSPWRADAKIHAVNLCQYFTSQDHQLRGVFGDMADEREELIKIFKRKNKGDDKIVIVDDSLIGAKMAKDQNIPSILVSTGKIPKSELEKYSENVFADFGENRWEKVIGIIGNL